jgi:hypothetical protein
MYSDMSKEEELRALANAIAVYQRREHPLLHERSKSIAGCVWRNLRWEIEREGRKS